MALIPAKRSAWFSSSVPKSKAQIWVERDGVLEPDAFQADFLFSESSEAADVQRIFESKEFLEGHLTVFSSDIIAHAAKQETVNRFDIMKCILLPKKELEAFEVTSRRSRKSKNARRHTVRGDSRSLDRFQSHDDFVTGSPNREGIRKTYPLRSKKSSTINNISKNSPCTMKMKSVLQSSLCTSGTDDYLSQSSSTSATVVFKKNNITSRHFGIFHHSLNFDIAHLADMDVPHVKIKDFIPGLNGCRVMKRPAKLFEEIIS